MKRLYILAIFLISFSFLAIGQQQWFKGNTHMHTDFSDGDSPIADVVQWYHDHGYNFISITDHNKTTIPADHLNLEDYRDDFLMIIGNEITSSVHFTALGVKNEFSVKSILKDYEEGTLSGYELPDADSTKLGHCQILINGMLKEGALVFTNHPNFGAGISAEEMLQLRGVLALELHNAHPAVYSNGNDRHVPVEEKWDYLLSNGMKIYAVGSDDEHHLKKWGPDAANPGRSWIMVEADELSQDNIIGSILLGKFYASTGLELSEYSRGPDGFYLGIDRKKTLKNIKEGLGNPHITDSGTEGFKIEVISFGGEVIHSVSDTNLDFEYPMVKGYIRVRASYCLLEEGQYKTYYAWGQPVFFR